MSRSSTPLSSPSTGVTAKSDEEIELSPRLSSPTTTTTTTTTTTPTSDDDDRIRPRSKRVSTVSSSKHEDYEGDLRRGPKMPTRRAEGEGGRMGADGVEVEEDGWVNSLDQGQRGELRDAGTLEFRVPRKKNRGC